MPHLHYQGLDAIALLNNHTTPDGTTCNSTTTVYFALVMCSDKQLQCYPSHVWLAGKIALGEATIKRALAVMLDLGAIELVPVDKRSPSQPKDGRKNVYQVAPSFEYAGKTYSLLFVYDAYAALQASNASSIDKQLGHTDVIGLKLSSNLSENRAQFELLTNTIDSLSNTKDSTGADKSTPVRAVTSTEEKDAEGREKPASPSIQYASVAYIEQANKNGLNAQRLYDYVMTPSAPAMPAPLPISQVKGYKKSEYYLVMQAILRLTTHPDKRDGMLLGAVLGELYKRRITIKRLLGFLRWYQHTYPKLSYPKVWQKTGGGMGWLDYLADYDTKHPDTSQAHAETSAGDYAPLGIWTGQGEPKVAPWHMAIRNVHGWTNDGEAAVEIVIIARETDGGGE